MTTATTTTPSDTRARERLTESLQQIVVDAELLLKNAQQTGSEQFVSARQRFETQLQHAKAELSRIQADAMEHARRAARATDQAVHQHPYAAMGISAGVGLLLGMLIARR